MYIIVTLIFLADLIANFVVFTLKEIFLRKKILFLEIGLQILSVVALISEYVPGVIDNYDGVKLYQAISYLRLFGIVRLLVELKEFKIIVSAIMNLATPFLSLLISLYTVFYLYAIGGQIWFGGLVKTNGP